MYPSIKVTKIVKRNKTHTYKHTHTYQSTFCKSGNYQK